MSSRLPALASLSVLVESLPSEGVARLLASWPGEDAAEDFFDLLEPLRGLGPRRQMLQFHPHKAIG